MKARIPPIRQLNRKQKAALRELCAAENQRQINEGVIRAQWIMLIALNEALGLGEDRLARVLAVYPALLEEYGGYKRDDVADEMLERRVRKLLPTRFEGLHAKSN